MSLIAVIAAVIYLVTTAACLFAWMAARYCAKPQGQRVSWGAGAILFLLLTIIRLLDLENLARGSLRAMLRQEGVYADRWSYQQPLAVIGVLAAAATALLGVRMLARRRRPAAQLALLGQLAMWGLIALYFVRLVSLHFIDRLLYGGGLHLNWFLEGGLCLLAGGAAVLYARHCRRGGA